MPLSPYALLDVEEMKGHVGAGGAAKDPVLEGVINRVSDEIEAHLGRQIVTRGSLTEYHTMRAEATPVGASDLRTLEWPIITVTSVHEDTVTPRTYGAGALLVVDTGYQVIKPTGTIRRIEGLGGLRNWHTGSRAIKVVYSAGYATTATVPARIKAVALRYAALIWGETKRGDFGVSGASDALGNYTRFAPAQLTPEMKSALAPEGRFAFWVSGERDV